MNKLPKLELEKLPRPERKKRIKAQNTMRKEQQAQRPSFEPLTLEKFDRQMTGFVMIALGLLKFAGIDPQELLEKAQARQAGKEDMPESANDYVN